MAQTVGAYFDSIGDLFGCEDVPRVGTSNEIIEVTVLFVQVDELTLRFTHFEYVQVVSNLVDYLALVQAPDRVEVRLEYRFYLHFHPKLPVTILLLFYCFNRPTPPVIMQKVCQAQMR